MYYLILYIGAALVFIQGFRFAQLRRMNLFAVAAVNYVTAAVIAVVIYAAHFNGTFAFDPRAAAMGATTGSLYFIHLFVLLAAYRLVGTGVTMAIVNAASIVPVVVAHLLWPHTETMSSTRWVAVGMLPVVMILMRPTRASSVHFGFKTDCILLLNLVLAGTNLTLHKFATTLEIDGVRNGYHLVLFVTAAIVSTGYALWYRLKPVKAELGIGVLIGTANGAVTLLILYGITALTAVVFYLIAAPTTITLVLASSMLLWHERITPRQALGIALAISVVIISRQ